MKTGVIQFPESNQYREIYKAFQLLGHNKTRVIWHKETKIDELDIIFTNGREIVPDENISTILEHSPVLEALSAFAARGKVVVGTGKGFRLLLELGLLPGALKPLDTGLFYNEMVHVKPVNNKSAINSLVSKNQVLQLPVSTFHPSYTVDTQMLTAMRQNDQITYRTCMNDGRLSKKVNKTGSTENIAGICNPEKNIFGILPLPERGIIQDGQQSDGALIINSIFQSVQP